MITSKEQDQVERVFVAVDVMNLWYSGRDHLGSSVRVNYGKLKDLIRSRKLGSIPRALRLIAYTISTEEGSRDRNTKFIETLQKAGYEVRNRNLQREKGLTKPFASDWDVGIAVDAIKFVDNYDTFSLVSGDGDYAILLDELRQRNKYVEVITFKETASRLLHTSANRVIHLTDNEIFRRDYTDGEPNSQKPR